MLGAYYGPSALAPVTSGDAFERPAVRTSPASIDSVSQYLPTNGLGMLTSYKDGSLGSSLNAFRDGSLGYPHFAPTPARFGRAIRGLGACPCAVSGLGDSLTDKWTAMTTTQKAMAGAGVALIGFVGYKLLKRR